MRAAGSNFTYMLGRGVGVTFISMLLATLYTIGNPCRHIHRGDDWDGDTVIAIFSLRGRRVW